MKFMQILKTQLLNMHFLNIRLTRILPGLLILLSVVACSNKGIYEANQHSQMLECQKLPQSQVQDCLDRVGVSYEEYERQRQQVLSESNRM